MWFIDISRIGILGENIKVDDIVIKKKNFDKSYTCKRIEIPFTICLPGCFFTTWFSFRLFIKHINILSTF